MKKVGNIGVEENMEKELDLFEAWYQSQREFMESMMKAQKQIMGNMDMFHTWVDQMVNSSKVYNDEAMKMQKAWRETFEKQMEMSRGITKTFFEATKKAA